MTDIHCFQCGFSIRVCWELPEQMKFCPYCGTSNVSSMLAVSEIVQDWTVVPEKGNRKINYVR
jgi:hypothetical protein